MTSRLSSRPTSLPLAAWTAPACALVLAACTTDPPRPTAPALDSGPAPAVADAGAARPPRADDAPPTAGTGAAPAGSDAGTDVDAGAPAAAAAAPSSPSPDAVGGRASAFDRILVKPKDKGTTAEDVKAEVEKRTGLTVVRVRRTAGTWFMVELAPAPGGRTAEGQRTLVQDMQGAALFEHVEADRMLQMKMP